MRIQGLALGLILIYLDDAERKALNEFVVDEDVNGVNAGSGEGEALKPDNEMTGHESDVVRHLHRHGTFDRHFLVDGLAVLIDHGDLKFVFAIVLGSEAKAHGERALGVYDRGGLGGECVEGAGDDHLALVFGGEIAESSYL